MEELQGLWAQVQPVLTHPAVLIAIVVMLGISIAKKLIKLAMTAGVLFLLWILLQQAGVQIPV